MVRYAEVDAFDFEGLKIRDLTAAAPPASASIARVLVKSGVEHREARSTMSDKYYVCRRGSVRFRVEGESANLSIGDLLLVDRGEWFSYVNRGRDQAELLLVHAPPFDLEYEEFAEDA